MWSLLDRLGRPPLTAHLQRQVLEVHRTSLRLLREGGAAGDDGARKLMVSLDAAAAGWRLLAAAESAEHRRAVKGSLRRQRALTGRSSSMLLDQAMAFERLAGAATGAAESRCLTRLLERGPGRAAGLSAPTARALAKLLAQRSGWLEGPADGAGDADGEVRRALTRLYRKARRALREQPRRRRTRRRLANLLWGEELLHARPEGAFEGRLPGGAAARLWLGLEEDRWLRRLPASSAAAGLSGKDRRRLARVVAVRRQRLWTANGALVSRVTRASPETYRERLDWRVFAWLADMPVPLTVADRPRLEPGHG